MNPKHCVATCPICGGGLCGVRICGLNDHDSRGRTDSPGQIGIHGLVICDECEAIWLEPDVTTVHQYPALADAKCPTCLESLWGDQSRWADQDDVHSLRWDAAINHSLDAIKDDAIEDEGIV